MNKNESTPFESFHEAIRSHFDNGETHQASELNQVMAIVLRFGEIPNFQIGADGKSIAPKLTPESNQSAYELFVKCAALKFRNSLTKKQILCGIAARGGKLAIFVNSVQLLTCRGRQH